MLSFLQRYKKKRRFFRSKKEFKRPVLYTYDMTQENRCVGCGLCVAVCPVQALQVEASLNQSNEFELKSFVFDTDVCLQCDMCVDACPTRALDFVETSEYTHGVKLTLKDLLNQEKV